MKKGDCPSCGGHLAWDPEALEFDCDGCGDSFTEEDLEKVGRG